MAQPSHNLRVSHHYDRAGLTEAILAGLRSAGKNPDHFDYDDLSAVDHFHTLGKEATASLAQLVDPSPGTRVLDVGGGLGGPARMLAAEFGCDVTVVDLTAGFCRLGELLTERAGLSARVRFREGDALSLPFDDASFDLVWTQHCTMNIPDKAHLYRELARVLPRGGRLAFHEIMAGPVQPVRFPVPWASSAELSHLLPPDEVRALVERAGFRVEELRDGTIAACDWYRQRLANPPSVAPPLGLHLLVGPQSPLIFENVLQNYAEGRTVVIQAVCVKQ